VVNGNFCPKLERIVSYSTFSLHGISLLALKYWGVLGENDPQKVKISKNTCLKGTSLGQSASFELLCGKSVHGHRLIRLYACQGIYKQKIITKARDPHISPSRGGAIAETIFTKLGRVAETLDVITLSKFQIN